MINLLPIILFNFVEFFKIPQSIDEMGMGHWVFVFVVILIILLILIKIWHKLIMFLIKLVIFAFVVVAIYLLVIG